MSIDEITFPEELKGSHFAHKIEGDFYLVPNGVLTESENHRKFECWLVNSDGTIAKGAPYHFTKEKLGL